MLQQGDLVSDKYRLIAPRASGGMGTVWRAHHTELQVDVALKLMAAGLADEDGKNRFRLEARAAARLRSPHIVQVLDFGSFDDQLYLAMELLDGEDLADRIDRSGSLPPEECLVVVEQMASAMDLAHAAGIIHRDLKPGNVFLAKQGDAEVVKVLDFGIAKDLRAQDRGSTTATVGSPAYMSPEQVWGEPLDAATDLWSMGVIALEMLTGTNPFQDETVARMYQQVVSDVPRRPSEMRAGLSVAFDAFFARALAREPSARFAGARAFAQAFRAAVDEHRAAKDRATLPARIPAEMTKSELDAPANDRGPLPGRRWLAVLLLMAVAACVAWLALRAPASPEPVAVSAAAPATTVAVEASSAKASPVEESLPSPAPSATAPATAATASAAASSRRGRLPRDGAPASAAPTSSTDPVFGIPLPSTAAAGH